MSTLALESDNIRMLGGPRAPMRWDQEKVTQDMFAMATGRQVKSDPSFRNNNVQFLDWFQTPEPGKDPAQRHVKDLILLDFEMDANRLAWVLQFLADYHVLTDVPLDEYRYKIEHFPTFVATATSEHELGQLVVHNVRNMKVRSQRFSIGVLFDPRKFNNAEHARLIILQLRQAISGFTHRAITNVLNEIYASPIPTPLVELETYTGTYNDQQACYHVQRLFGEMNKDPDPSTTLAKRLKNAATSPQCTFQPTQVVMPFNHSTSLKAPYFLTGAEIQKRNEDFTNGKYNLGYIVHESPCLNMRLLPEFDTPSYRFDKTKCVVGEIFAIDTADYDKIEIWDYKQKKYTAVKDPSDTDKNLKSKQCVLIRFVTHETSAIVLAGDKPVLCQMMNPNFTVQSGLQRMERIDYEAYLATVSKHGSLVIPQMFYRRTVDGGVDGVTTFDGTDTDTASASVKAWLDAGASSLIYIEEDPGKIKNNPINCINNNGRSDFMLKKEGNAIEAFTKAVTSLFTANKSSDSILSAFSDSNSPEPDPINSYVFHGGYRLIKDEKVKKTVLDKGVFYGYDMEEFDKVMNPDSKSNKYRLTVQ